VNTIFTGPCDVQEDQAM